MEAEIIVALVGFAGTALTVLIPVLTSNNKIGGKLDRHITEDENNTAENWRVRILRFDDDLCDKAKLYPSEASFQQAIFDCDKYEAYMMSHPNFHNGIGKQAMEHIREVYADVKSEDLFGEQK